MRRSPLIAVGAHTCEHLVMRHMSDSDQRRDLTGCRQQLEEMFRRWITCFAYPFCACGRDFDARTEANSGPEPDAHPVSASLAPQRLETHNRDCASCTAGARSLDDNAGGLWEIDQSNDLSERKSEPSGIRPRCDSPTSSPPPHVESAPTTRKIPSAPLSATSSSTTIVSYRSGFLLPRKIGVHRYVLEVEVTDPDVRATAAGTLTFGH
jgi:Polysaccharide deacetylase